MSIYIERKIIFENLRKSIDLFFFFLIKWEIIEDILVLKKVSIYTWKGGFTK